MYPCMCHKTKKCFQKLNRHKNVYNKYKKYQTKHVFQQIQSPLILQHLSHLMSVLRVILPSITI